MAQSDSSNVGIKMKNDQSLVFDTDELSADVNHQQINANNTPIITQNVPFTNPTKPISKWYLALSINFHCSCFLIILLLVSSLVSQPGTYLLASYMIISYIVYLVAAYQFSNLLFLTDLRSLHEYKDVFEKLVHAECALNFTYIASRTRIDEGAKRYEQEYKKVKIGDKSGRLYNIERHYSLALIKYHKRFYYSDNNTKVKVTSDFLQFVQRSRKELQGNKRRLISSRQKIQLKIKDLVSEIGYYIQEDNHYKLLFLLTLFLGFGVYFEYYMSKKILRYEMDIVKQICLI